MLYNQEQTLSVKLENEMRSIGFSEEQITKAIEYLINGDEKVLNSIEKVDFDLSVYSSKLSGLKQIVYNELRDTLLRERWLEVAMKLGETEVYELAQIYSHSQDKIVQAAKKAFGNRGDAYMCALRFKNYSRSLYLNMHISNIGALSAEMANYEPEVYAEAVEFSDGMFYSTLILCIMALEHSPLPGLLKNRPTPAAKKACELIMKMHDPRQTYSSLDLSFLLTAMAEAAYFNKDAKALFGRLIKGNVDAVLEYADNLPVNTKRILDMTENFPECLTHRYFFYVVTRVKVKADRDERLRCLIKQYPEQALEAIERCELLQVSKILTEVYIEVWPEKAGKLPDLHMQAVERLADVVSKWMGDVPMVADYIVNGGDFNSILPVIQGKKLSYSGSTYDYYKGYGADVYVGRALAILMNTNEHYGFTDRIYEITGFGIENNEEEAIKLMMMGGMDFSQVLQGFGKIIENSYGVAGSESLMDKYSTGAEKYPDELLNVSLDGLSVTAKFIYIKALEKAMSHIRIEAPDEGGRTPAQIREDRKTAIHNIILYMAGETSKNVRAALADVIADVPAWRNDVAALMSDKKSAKRELALAVIEKQGVGKYTDELKTAYKTEKSAKVRDRIGTLLGIAAAAPEKKSAIGIAEKIAELTKGSKVSKLSWLCEKPLPAVRCTSGETADENFIKAMMLCYADMVDFAVSATASEIASGLERSDLEALCTEIFIRWIDKGAAAKTKWVLYFCAVFGNNELMNEYVRCIKDWAENSRGAIASEAVRAMALNGSSPALMEVDQMSRKFKNKQVKKAAGEALANAAAALGITTEELADRIVPDLGFDENLCRVFDFGPRQFNVYLTPSMELEVFCGDKKMKTLPKPGANDDKEKAESAVNSFKELKKQIKTIVSSQKQRLEYVLMCDRKWTAEGWNSLFVKNAVMHCFAQGLIWGAYENGSLCETFRYMEDGSFTTADGDEYTLPENALIGLIHPVELTDEQKEAWKEHLSDYEIVQPFTQIERTIYTAGPKSSGAVTAFADKEINSLSLLGKMTKFGWYKGTPEDAGFYYYFYREDLSARIRNDDGSFTSQGSAAMLCFSGMPVQVYDFDGETVTTGDLMFYAPGKQPDHYRPAKDLILDPAQISPRYYSEVMLQLYSIFSNEKT